jgi:hypothetical protein
MACAKTGQALEEPQPVTHYFFFPLFVFVDGQYTVGRVRRPGELFIPLHVSIALPGIYTAALTFAQNMRQIFGVSMPVGSKHANSKLVGAQYVAPHETWFESIS